MTNDSLPQVRIAVKPHRWKGIQEFPEKQDVTLLSAGLEEVPLAYKNIHDVMNAQLDLAKPLAKFMPRLVKIFNFK